MYLWVNNYNFVSILFMMWQEHASISNKHRQKSTLTVMVCADLQWPFSDTAVEWRLVF